jgi:hypothetical protein
MPRQHSRRQAHNKAPWAATKQKKALDVDSMFGSDTADAEAEYLNELIKEFQEEGPQMSNYGDRTLEMIWFQRHRWQQ